MKSFLSILLAAAILLSPLSASASYLLPEADTETSTAELTVSAPSVLLMEVSTGSVIYEKNAHEKLRPASITKIMTLILIFDAIANGQISLNDTVTVSEYAASMGGSQVYLEPGETQTVETMIKCISIASANDACVAMSEFIAGSESEFVRMMNERAAGLGMEDTTFVNCCGLDTDGHITSAYDVALMSRELTSRYPEIHNYCTVWMENITHTTARGSSEFGLTNTNKLIRQYEYATGLKTGSTGLAKYCVSATAVKDGMELIAVVMAAPDYKVRFSDAATLLNYGFSKYRVYTDANEDALSPIPVQKGVSDQVSVTYESPFEYLSTDGSDLSGVTKTLELPETAEAPIKKGAAAGKAVYTLNGTEIGTVLILYTDNVDAATYRDYFVKALHCLLL
uniref:D-alanyl-D-alanine carboxypeptidase family protein n=1 Tax=Roseburia sp. TaxID=2049040 RepID=UPI003FEE9040